MTKKIFVFGAVGAVLAAAVGCSSPVDDDEAAEAPEAVELGTEAQQILYSTNADGTWSANATGTDADSTANRAHATFTGPAGKTRRMGVCLLKKYGGFNGTPCTTTAQCGAAPTTLPAGGFRYCAAPQNTGQKYCFFRPGPPTTYCAGTPAQNLQPVSPGAKSTPIVVSGKGMFVSYACFEGCSATDPSTSSAEQATPDLGQVMCGKVYC